jgi:hypothetical protein
MHTGLLALALVALRQAVAQPAAGAGDEFDRGSSRPTSSLSSRYRASSGFRPPVDAALGKLPGIAAADAPRPQQPPGIVGDDDTDVGAETLRIDHDG